MFDGQIERSINNTALCFIFIFKYAVEIRDFIKKRFLIIFMLRWQVIWNTKKRICFSSTNSTKNINFAFWQYSQGKSECFMYQQNLKKKNPSENNFDFAIKFLFK